jgi:hypothetical protein
MLMVATRVQMTDVLGDEEVRRSRERVAGPPGIFANQT